MRLELGEGKGRVLKIINYKIKNGEFYCLKTRWKVLGKCRRKMNENKKENDTGNGKKKFRNF